MLALIYRIENKMRNLFKGFNPPNEAELNNLWKNAIFVFDTNILTNLYRYQSSTSAALLKVMEQLGDRVWIPYHVALEYQRNRLTVIHGQHKKFDDTKSAVKGAINSLNKALKDLQLEKRHSHINPDKFISEVTSLSDKFCLDLDSLETESIKISSKDHLLSSLEKLFEGKVGNPPTSEFIKDLEKEGKERFDNSIPPGYKDKDKAKQSDNLFTFGGIKYQRHYGDLIVWKQLISHIKDKKIKHIIFVTDDSKEDWWQITKGKTTGFRPELIDEIYRETCLDCFHAYNSVSFLSNSNIQLGNTVSDEAIEEVKLVAKNNEHAVLKSKNKLLIVKSLGKERKPLDLQKIFEMINKNKFLDDDHDMAYQEWLAEERVREQQQELEYEQQQELENDMEYQEWLAEKREQEQQQELEDEVSHQEWQAQAPEQEK